MSDSFYSANFLPLVCKCAESRWQQCQRRLSSEALCKFLQETQLWPVTCSCSSSPLMLWTGGNAGWLKGAGAGGTACLPRCKSFWATKPAALHALWNGSSIFRPATVCLPLLPTHTLVCLILQTAPDLHIPEPTPKTIRRVTTRDVFLFPPPAPIIFITQSSWSVCTAITLPKPPSPACHLSKRLSALPEIPNSPQVLSPPEAHHRGTDHLFPSWLNSFFCS